jgi:hypothetical protein
MPFEFGPFNGGFTPISDRSGSELQTHQIYPKHAFKTGLSTGGKGEKAVFG